MKRIKNIPICKTCQYFINNRCLKGTMATRQGVDYEVTMRSKLKEGATKCKGYQDKKNE